MLGGQWRINHRADGARARAPGHKHIFRYLPGSPQQLLLPQGVYLHICISRNDNTDFAIIMIDPTFHIQRPRSANKKNPVWIQSRCYVYMGLSISKVIHQLESPAIVAFEDVAFVFEYRY